MIKIIFVLFFWIVWVVWCVLIVFGEVFKVLMFDDDKFIFFFFYMEGVKLYLNIIIFKLFYVKKV